MFNTTYSMLMELEVVIRGELTSLSSSHRLVFAHNTIQIECVFKSGMWALQSLNTNGST